LGYTGVPYIYSTSATDPDEDLVQYRFYWDDGTYSEWTSLVPSGRPASQSHTWTSAGIYEVIAQAKDKHGATSLWSISWPVVISTPTTNDDSNDKEVGVEWVSDFPGEEHDRLSDLAPEDFYVGLGNLGWTQRFDHGYGYSHQIYQDDVYSASERHFEKPENGGWDYNYIDAVDFAWFQDHGDENCIVFASDTDGDGEYGGAVYWHEAEWGDGDLEWIVLSACEVLSDKYSTSPPWSPYPASSSVFDRWGYPVFKGLHAILSFKSISFTCASLGNYLVEYMTGEKGPYPIIEAWYRATLETECSGVWAAYLAEWHDEDDYLPGYGLVGPDANPPIVMAYNYWQIP